MYWMVHPQVFPAATDRNGTASCRVPHHHWPRSMVVVLASSYRWSSSSSSLASKHGGGAGLLMQAVVVGSLQLRFRRSLTTYMIK